MTKARRLGAPVTRAFFDDLRRAFREFLTLPTLVIAGFVALAILSSAIDRLRPEALGWLTHSSSASPSTRSSRWRP